MRKSLFLATFLTMLTTTYAQFRAGIFGGVANYQGDLTEDIFQSPRPAVGLQAGYGITRRIGLRAGFTYARLVGADSLNESPDLRLRNLDFQTHIYEFHLAGEINFLDLELKRWTPYAFGGIAVFRFNPYTYDAGGNRVFLHPLSTEGQGLPGSGIRHYNLTQLAIPFGGGIKFNINSAFQLQLELGLRKLFTDYLDDVSGNYADEAELLAEKGPLAVEISYRSDEAGGDLFYPVKGTQRGSPRYDDFYYFTGLQLNYFFGNGLGRKNDRLGCPKL